MNIIIFLKNYYEEHLQTAASNIGQKNQMIMIKQ